jgi:hypothetical protein
MEASLPAFSPNSKGDGHMSKNRVASLRASQADKQDVQLQIMNDLEQLSSALKPPGALAKGKDTAAERRYPRRERAASVAARPPLNT